MVELDLFKKAEQEWKELLHGSRPAFFVGNATCGRSAGSMEVIHALKKEIETRKLEVDVFEVGCIGMCYAEPIVGIYQPETPFIFYEHIDEKEAINLIDLNILKNEISPKNIIGVLQEDAKYNLPSLGNLAVMKPQTRLVLQNCGIIDPTNINHYIANKGYSGLKKTLKMDSNQVLDVVKESGLRGRGGAGFPTWKKWQFCKETANDQKYLICNADEGDPGAFMNRSLLDRKSVV